MGSGLILPLPDAIPIPYFSKPAPPESYVLSYEDASVSRHSDDIALAPVGNASLSRRSSRINTSPVKRKASAGLIDLSEVEDIPMPLQSLPSVAKLSHMPSSSQIKSQKSSKMLTSTKSQFSSKAGWVLKRAVIQPNYMESIEIGKIIGTGLMGTVRIAKWKENNGYFALKAIRRDYINKHHDQRHVASERNILRSMSSSFCIRLFGAFEDTTNLYFATELAVGGELMRRLSKKRSFGPQTAKFYTCEIFSALEHVQSLGYVYRDLKPENVMIDEEGHCKLIDFGFTIKPNVNGQMTTFCGTPAYLSPEQLNGKFTNGYTSIVDWWSLGVFLYELLTGKTPFCHKNSESVYEIYTRILRCRISFPSSNVDANSKELISALCLPDLGKRLVDAARIKQHTYFNTVDWHAVEKRRLIPPFVPNIKEVGDLHYFSDHGEFMFDNNKDVEKVLLTEF